MEEQKLERHSEMDVSVSQLEVEIFADLTVATLYDWGEEPYWQLDHGEWKLEVKF